jgi:hypothetical protein
LCIIKFQTSAKSESDKFVWFTWHNQVPWIGSQASANPALIVVRCTYLTVEPNKMENWISCNHSPLDLIPFIFAVSFLNQTPSKFMGLAIHKCQQHIQSNCCPEYVTSQFKLHRSSKTGSDDWWTSQVHIQLPTLFGFKTFYSAYNKIFSHSCDRLPFKFFIPGTAHHLIYCLIVLVSWSYQWIPIDIFVQQVSRPGLTKGSIPGTLRLWQQGQGWAS